MIDFGAYKPMQITRWIPEAKHAVATQELRVWTVDCPGRIVSCRSKRELEKKTHTFFFFTMSFFVFSWLIYRKVMQRENFGTGSESRFDRTIPWLSMVMFSKSVGHIWYCWINEEKITGEVCGLMRQLCVLHFKVPLILFSSSHPLGANFSGGQIDLTCARHFVNGKREIKIEPKELLTQGLVNNPLHKHRSCPYVVD